MSAVICLIINLETLTKRIVKSPLQGSGLNHAQLHSYDRVSSKSVTRILFDLLSTADVSSASIVVSKVTII